MELASSNHTQHAPRLPMTTRGSLLGPMSCCSALALYVCLRSAGAAIAIDAVMKVASTNCASINELAQLGTFNTRAHGPWVSRFAATGAHVLPSISVPHLGLQPNTVKKGSLRLACAVSSPREAPLTQTTELTEYVPKRTI